MPEDNLENSEHTREELNGSGRLSYLLGEEVECVRERCVRVAATINACVEGSKNNCV